MRCRIDFSLHDGTKFTTLSLSNIFIKSYCWWGRGRTCNRVISTLQSRPFSSTLGISQLSLQTSISKHLVFYYPGVPREHCVTNSATHQFLKMITAGLNIPARCTTVTSIDWHLPIRFSLHLLRIASIPFRYFPPRYHFYIFKKLSVHFQLEYLLIGSIIEDRYSSTYSLYPVTLLWVILGNPFKYPTPFNTLSGTTSLLAVIVGFVFSYDLLSVFSR